jgi:SNF2 family DNA or RNA helicase
MTATYNPSSQTIELRFPYNPLTVLFIKQLAGRKYIPKTGTWTLPIAGSVSVLPHLERRGFVIDKAVWDAGVADEEQVRELEALQGASDCSFETTLPLFPYQKVGAAFLVKIGSGILGDDVGMGKSVMAIAVCETTRASKVLIIAPSSIKWQWHQELFKFLPSSDAVVIEGTPRERAILWRSEHQFYIANYELLLRDLPLIQERQWGIAIADEATRISNPTAKVSKAIKKIKATRRIAMTGTPISNRAQEVWNLVDWVSPDALGNYYSFMDRYCIKNKWGGVEQYRNMDELASKLKRHMIRRMKVDVLTELPEKIVTDVPFDMSDEEMAMYRKLKKEILFEIKAEEIDKIENPMSVQYTLVKLLRLRQLTDSMELLGQNTASSKLVVLKDILAEALSDPRRKAIVFTQFSVMADILERELAEYGTCKVSGAIKEEYKDVIERFNTDDTKRILIMTSAGMYGLNIQAASVVVHYDQEWSLAKMTQRDGRAHRYGQKETVLVYNLMARKTVDYYVQKVLRGKAELAGRLLGDEKMTMTDIKTMLEYE